MISTIALYSSISISLILVAKKAAKSFEFDKNKQWMAYFFVWLIMVLLAVFRPIGYGYGGADALEYIKYFENLDVVFEKNIFSFSSLSKLFQSKEPLFYLLNFIIRQLTNDYHYLFFVIYAFIAYAFLYFVNCTYTKKSSFFTVCFVISEYIYSFNIIRGGISVAFCMLAFVALVRKKYLRASLLCIIGAMFHYVGFCFLLVIVFVKIMDNPIKVVKPRILLLIVLIFNLIIIIASVTIKNFFMTTKYASYMSNNLHYSILGHIPSVVISILAILVYDKLHSDRINRVTMLSLTVSVSLMYMTVYLGAWRISDFFDLIKMLFLSIAIENADIIAGKNKQLFRLFVFSLLLVTLFQSYKSLYESSYVFPYFV